MKKTIISLFLIVFASMPVFADTGTAAMPFLKLGGGARGAALGGAFSAIADDSTSVFYNPAATVFLDRKEVAFSHSLWLEDMSLEHISYAQPLSPYMSAMFGAAALRSGSMRSYDEAGVSGGSFSAMDVAVSGGISYIVSQRFYAGAQVKLFSQSADSDSARSLGADLGAVIRGDILRYSVSVLNLGSDIKLGSYAFSLPRTIRAGVSKELFSGFRGSAEYINYVDSGSQFAAGAEYRIRIRPDDDLQALSLRVGYYGGHDKNTGSGISGGVGFRTSDLSLDYAFTPYGDLGSAHRFTLSLAFGESRENMRETYDYHYRSREENRRQSENKLFKKGQDRVADMPTFDGLDEYKPEKEDKKIRDFNW